MSEEETTKEKMERLKKEIELKEEDVKRNREYLKKKYPEVFKDEK